MTTQTEKCFLCAEYVNQLDEHIQQHKDTLKAFRELEQASKLQNGSVILENCYMSLGWKKKLLVHLLPILL